MRTTLFAVVLVLTWAGRGVAAPPDPGEDYLLHCSGCHGPDGRGVPGVVPSLHGLGWLLGAPGGRDYLVRVPGVAQAPLSDERLARLLAWVLDRWSDAQANLSAEEIARLRREPLRDPLGARSALH